MVQQVVPQAGLLAFPLALQQVGRQVAPLEDREVVIRPFLQMHQQVCYL